MEQTKKILYIQVCKTASAALDAVFRAHPSCMVIDDKQWAQVLKCEAMREKLANSDIIYLRNHFVDKYFSMMPESDWEQRKILFVYRDPIERMKSGIIQTIGWCRNDVSPLLPVRPYEVDEWSHGARDLSYEANCLPIGSPGNCCYIHVWHNLARVIRDIHLATKRTELDPKILKRIVWVPFTAIGQREGLRQTLIDLHLPAELIDHFPSEVKHVNGGYHAIGGVSRERVQGWIDRLLQPDDKCPSLQARQSILDEYHLLHHHLGQPVSQELLDRYPVLKEDLSRENTPRLYMPTADAQLTYFGFE